MVLLGSSCPEHGDFRQIMDELAFSWLKDFYEVFWKHPNFLWASWGKQLTTAKAVKWSMSCPWVRKKPSVLLAALGEASGTLVRSMASESGIWAWHLNSAQASSSGDTMNGSGCFRHRYFSLYSFTGSCRAERSLRLRWSTSFPLIGNTERWSKDRGSCWQHWLDVGCESWFHS